MRPPLRLSDLFEASARRLPRHIFLTWREGGEATYQEAQAAVEAAAVDLERAGMSGRLIGLMLVNRPELVVAWLACQRAGVVPVFLNPDLAAAELEVIAADLDLALIVADEAALVPAATPALRLSDRWGVDLAKLESKPPEPASSPGVPAPLAGGSGEVEAAAIGAVVLTSGSTGRPKYVAVPHEAYTLKATLNGLGLGWSAEDRAYAVMPLFHVGGQAETVAPAIAAGARIDLIERFSASGLWRDLGRLGATHLHGTGSLLAMAIARGEGGPPPTLARIVASFRPDLVASLRELAPRAALVTVYGLTECPLGTLSMPGDELTPGWVGMPYTGADQVRIRADEPGGEGEIQFRNAACTLGYLGPDAEDPFTDDGWLKTGDIGRLADGGLLLTGRIKAMIRRSGENISPAQLELETLELAGVAEVAALAEPDPVRDEEVRLVIEPRPGVDLPEPAEIRRLLGQRLADFKLPRYIDIVDELPRLANGKIDKPALSRQLGPPAWDFER